MSDRDLEGHAHERGPSVLSIPTPTPAQYEALRQRGNIAGFSIAQEGPTDGALPHGADVTITIHIRRRKTNNPSMGDKGYIAAYTRYPARDGETVHRGNDLADGDASAQTLERVIDDVRAVYTGARS